MSDPIDPATKLWGVDRSWSQRRGNANGDLAESDQTKLHIDRGDSTAKCSPRVFLNSLDCTLPIGFGGAIYADQPAGTIAEFERDMPGAICRRCVPRPKR